MVTSICLLSGLACQPVVQRADDPALTGVVARSVLDANAELLAETTPSEPEVATTDAESSLTPAERARFERFWRQVLEEGYGADADEDALEEPDAGELDVGLARQPVRWDLAARRIPLISDEEPLASEEDIPLAESVPEGDLAIVEEDLEPPPDPLEEDPLEEELAIVDQRVDELELELLEQQRRMQILGLAIALAGDQLVAARALAIRIAAQQQLLHDTPRR